MNDFNWKEFKKDEIAVWCKTEEIAKDFLKECDKQGIKWRGGDSTTKYDMNYERYGNKTCFSDEGEGLLFGPKELYREEHFNIIEWKLQTEFTFQEVVARNVPGVYVNCSDDGERIKSIEIWNNGDFKINGDFRGLDVFGCPLGIDKSLKFKLQEPKKQCVLYGIEHKEDGKIYYFRNKGNFRNKGAKVIPDGSFVVCDTSQGKSYGKAVQRIKKELTEEEYLNYKECWRA